MADRRYIGRRAVACSHVLLLLHNHVNFWMAGRVRNEILIEYKITV